MRERELTAECFELDKETARKIMLLVIPIIKDFPEVSTDANLRRRFKAIHGKPLATTGATNWNAIDLMTLAMLGPTEKKLFSDITAYGQMIIDKIMGGEKIKSDPEALQKRLDALPDNVTMAFAQLLNAVDLLSVDFPPTPPDEPEKTASQPRPQSFFGRLFSRSANSARRG